jgi:hypothetical protein
MQRRKASKPVNQSRELKESMGNFDRLLRAVVDVPKDAVEKEEAKERLKNRMQRLKRKKATKKKT